MTRQEANLKIADIFKAKGYKDIGEDLEYYAKMLPDQRAGQIFCNYIFPEYRTEKVPLLEKVFPNNLDPFYEESVETLKNVKTLDF